MTTTINDLYERYSDLSGSEGPGLDRAALDTDYRDWCRAHGRVSVDGRGYVSGTEYLAAADGPFSAAALSDDQRPAATLEIAARSGEEDGVAWVADNSDNAAAALADPLEPDEALINAVGLTQLIKEWGVEHGSDEWRAALRVYNEAWRKAVRANLTAE